MAHTEMREANPFLALARAARTSAQREACDAAIAAVRAELKYAGRDGGELMRLERVTNQAWEAARRTGLAMPDMRWR
ncbi:hypothetical protein ACIBTV_25395 [Micromonospora sp. NPDC049366]|uniref:hypothetical protein n=1 Tax=Micromonospora sp. NPDC049366 TaxID=3364271 RepID=UPI0037BA652F